MLYHFLYPLSQDIGVFNVFRYITFRTLVSFLIATLVSVIWGRIFIKYMKSKQFGQVVRNDGPSAHLKKTGTPTMGGVFIVGSILITLLITANFHSAAVLVSLFVLISFFVLGLIDDYLKVLKSNSRGVSARKKLIWQFSTAIIAAYYLVDAKVVDTALYAPFLKSPILDLGYLYILFAAVVIVGSSNAVNLTDGLDGLAIGPIITSSGALAVLAYAAGHRFIADYLHIPYIEGVGELTVVASAIIGAGTGFLWYNSYPAQIFMGDVGSLSLGGILGVTAVVSKNELLFVIIGGIFVVETVSVILQVVSYKLKKKRIFKMAPIHHHFELLGLAEPKVIVRFWIISIFLALFAVATLKMR